MISDFTNPGLIALPHLQPEGWPDIVPFFRFYIDSPFCEPVKLTSDGKLAGTGCIIRHKDTAWLSHIIVHKDFRNQGLGTIITRNLIERNNFSLIRSLSLIATALGEPVYRKLGFISETIYTVYKRKPDAVIVPYDLSPADRTAEREQILELDKEVSGENREVLLLPHLISAITITEGGKLSGFYLPTLGEGLIIAANPDAGAELMKAKLATKPEGWVLPLLNTHGCTLLEENGYVADRNIHRMYLSGRTGLKADMLYSRIGGNLG